MNHVVRARLVSLVEHGTTVQLGILGRAKQGDTIRVEGASPPGRGQGDAKESDKGCFRVQEGQVQGQAVERGYSVGWPSSTVRARQDARPRRTTPSVTDFQDPISEEE